MTSDLYVNMLEGHAMRDVEVAMGGSPRWWLQRGLGSAHCANEANDRYWRRPHRQQGGFSGIFGGWGEGGRLGTRRSAHLHKTYLEREGVKTIPRLVAGAGVSPLGVFVNPYLKNKLKGRDVTHRLS